MKFKIGDKVRILKTSYPVNCPVGHVATVLDLYGEPRGYKLSAPEGTIYKPEGWFFGESEERNLQLIEDKKMSKFKVGDKVRVLSSDYLTPEYRPGGVLVVAEVSGNIIRAVSETNKRYPSGLNFRDTQVELVKQPKVATPKFKVGDILKRKKGSSFNITVSAVDANGYKIDSNRGYDTFEYIELEYELVTQTQASKFKIGDRVRILNSTGAARKPIADNGTETVIVEKLGTGTWPYAVEGNGVGWCAVLESNIELVNNMSKEIEVGDVVKIAKTSQFNRGFDNNPTDTEGTVTSTTNMGTLNYRVKWPAGDNTYAEHDLVLVRKKGSKSTEEVIAYELIKPLPGIPVGTKSETITTRGNKIHKFSVGDNSNAFNETQIADVTFFKPIYKPKEVVITVSGNRKVTILNGVADIKGIGTLKKEHVEELYKSLQQSTKVGGFKVTVKDATYSVGCQDFTKQDIESVYKAIQG
jgi:hypothetical protein